MLLHPHQAELVHGEAQGGRAVALGLGAQQFVEGSGSPGAPRGQESAAALAGGLVDPGGHLPHGLLAVENDADFVEVVVGLGGPTGDPGGLAQPELALDDQRVGGVAAGGVPVVELVSLEEAVGVEEVGSGEELGSRPHLTPGEEGSPEPPAAGGAQGEIPPQGHPGCGRRGASTGGSSIVGNSLPDPVATRG